MAASETKEKTASGSKARGSHATRTAAMRKKLIDAAIYCLGEFGYGGTTLQRVTDRAGVSRGAFLHHFPTRANLMMAVAEFAAESQTSFIRNILGPDDKSRRRFDEITPATWQAMLQPPAIALLEILLGSRSDPEMGSDFAQFMRDVESRQVNNVCRAAEVAGITDRETVVSMVHLHQAAMRGLVVEYLYSGDRDTVEKAMDLLIRYKAWLTEQLMAARAA